MQTSLTLTTLLKTSEVPKLVRKALQGTFSLIISTFKNLNVQCIIRIHPTYTWNSFKLYSEHIDKIYAGCIHLKAFFFS